ncbi:MAG: hypothetical protein M1820_007494 [Bogoriella megaspora]|nr:MAG: hypothetical protein M1820_007494 [Bogoriella megaspora]
MPNITLYFLQTSRAIRTAWLLEELNLDYNVVFSDRENGLAPPWFKEAIQKAGNPLGKSPTLVDNGVVVSESGTITEYLCEKYDTANRLIPKDAASRVSVLQWVHATEATFTLHALAITYLRWFAPQSIRDNGELEATEEKMGKNVQHDLDMLEDALEKNKGGFLIGDTVTAADCMMSFSIVYILRNGLGTGGRSWLRIDEWIKKCEATETWKKAVNRTGHAWVV